MSYTFETRKTKFAGALKLRPERVFNLYMLYLQNHSGYIYLPTQRFYNISKSTARFYCAPGKWAFAFAITYARFVCTPQRHTTQNYQNKRKGGEMVAITGKPSEFGTATGIQILAPLNLGYAINLCHRTASQIL